MHTLLFLVTAEDKWAGNEKTITKLRTAPDPSHEKEMGKKQERKERGVSTREYKINMVGKLYRV
jgi:hypothetical protein